MQLFHDEYFKIKIVSLVSFVVVAVTATNGVRGNNERITLSRENHTLKVVAP